MEYLTDLGFGGHAVLQDDEGYAFSQDSVLLANLADLKKGDSVLDLGCGSGILSILALLKRGASRAVGIEVQDKMCDMATRSAALNGLADRFEILRSDVKDIRKLVPAESFDKAVCNPPYFAKGAGGDYGGNEQRRVARAESTASLHDFVFAAAYALRAKGALSLIVKASRLATLLYEEISCGLQPKRLILCRPKEGEEADCAIAIATKGGGEGLKISDFAVRDKNGEYTSAYRELTEQWQSCI